MMTRRILAFAAIAALAVGTSYPASAQVDGYTVSIRFYSDATLTTQVGYARPVCTYTFAGATMQWGYSTQHRIETQGRRCVDGEYVDE